ncbi:hypothetical protein ACHAWF_015276 [Thalassiosira exigua]
MSEEVRDASAQQGSINQLMQMIADLQHTVRLQNAQLQAQTSEIQSIHDVVRDQLYQIQILQDDVRGLTLLDIYGCDEEDENRVLGSFIHNFKRLLKSLNGQFQHGQMYLDGNDRIYEYDVLRPYWNELARALLRPHIILAVGNDERSNFSMIRIPLTKNIRDVLAPGLMANAFRTLSLELSYLDRDGMVFLINLIQRNGSLKNFILVGSIFADSYGANDIVEDVNRLCQIMKEHPSIKLVEMEYCGSSTPSDLLCPIITASDRMKTIRLNRDNICTMGRTDVSDFLARNPSLETLQLMGNHLNDADAIAIARALETNNTLSWLDFSEGNDITSVSTEVFARLLFNPESLNAVSDSNHTLAGNFGDIDGWLSEFNRKYGSAEGGVEGVNLPSPNTAKKLKLLALLSAPYEKTVNTELLYGVPLELMPKVLEFVQQYPEAGSNEGHHWSCMARLRTDTPQEEQKYGANYLDENEDEIRLEGGLWEIRNDEWYGDDSDDADYHYSENDRDKRRQKIKCLTLVFEILRGCTIQSL